jgi:hypothetical protein
MAALSGHPIKAGPCLSDSTSVNRVAAKMVASFTFVVIMSMIVIVSMIMVPMRTMHVLMLHFFLGSRAHL